MSVTQSCIYSDRLELLILYYRNPSIKLRNQLVELHAGLVQKMARRFSYQCTQSYEDLEQTGYLGLIHAIERFNPNRGYAFSSFAIPYIQGEILHFLRDRTGIVKIPRRWQEIYKQGQKVRQELTSALGRPPKDSEIVQKLQVSVEEWQNSNLAAQNRITLSLDTTMIQHIDCPITLAEVLPDPYSNILQQQEEERQQLQQAISQLEEKVRIAVEFVFLKQLSCKETAKQIGTSPVTVTRYLKRGKEQLLFLLQSQVLQSGT